MNSRFNRVVEQAQERSQGNDMLIGTIIKELLHYDILYAIQKSKLNRSLIFQGGTALRLCYNSNRYSEDLDFALEGEMDDQAMSTFKEILTASIDERYGLDIEIRNPKPPKEGQVKVEVKTWCANVLIPTPTGPRTQKINIEVANIQSYENRPVYVKPKYDTLPQGYGNILMRVESQSEILADKVVALIGRPYYKARDLWDIKWLLDAGVKIKAEQVPWKIADYGIDEPDKKLRDKLEYIATTEAIDKFEKEMSRFVDNQTWSELSDFGSPARIITDQASEYISSVVADMELSSGRKDAPRVDGGKGGSTPSP